MQAAVSAGARYAVTTNREFLRQRGYAGTPSLTPDQFWQRGRPESPL